MRLGANEQRGIDSVRKNANEIHDDNCFRNGVNVFRILVNFFRKVILTKCTFVDAELSRLSLGVLSVVGRWN